LGQFSIDGEQYPPGPQSESTAQLPPTSHAFALLSADELRQRQGVRDPQFESVKRATSRTTVAGWASDRTGGSGTLASRPMYGLTCGKAA